jgi:hypothetical protein
MIAILPERTGGDELILFRPRGMNREGAKGESLRFSSLATPSLKCPRQTAGNGDYMQTHRLAGV